MFYFHLVAARSAPAHVLVRAASERRIATSDGELPEKRRLGLIKWNIVQNIL